MSELLTDSAYFGVFISLISYEIGVLARKKWNLALLNPLLVSAVLTIVALVFLHIDYQSYYDGAKYISYLLTPATICLAIPLYEQVELLKKNFTAVMCGILAGVVSSLCSVLLLAVLFDFSQEEYVTFLPKSITTAIGMDVSQELGGFVSITVAVIVITGLLGNIFGEQLFRWMKIEEPISRGVALGTASHAIGTAKAMELGEIEGAMSSLSIVVAGLMTVIGASVFAGFL